MYGNGAMTVRRAVARPLRALPPHHFPDCGGDDGVGRATSYDTSLEASGEPALETALAIAADG